MVTSKFWQQKLTDLSGSRPRQDIHHQLVHLCTGTEILTLQVIQL
jgi:hypothetical protein